MKDRSTTREYLVLGPELAGALLTPEEFDAAEDAAELFPGFDLPVARLLREADLLRDASSSNEG